MFDLVYVKGGGKDKNIDLWLHDLRVYMLFPCSVLSSRLMFHDLSEKEID